MNANNSSPPSTQDVRRVGAVDTDESSCLSALVEQLSTLSVQAPVVHVKSIASVAEVEHVPTITRSETAGSTLYNKEIEIEPTRSYVGNAQRPTREEGTDNAVAQNYHHLRIHKDEDIPGLCLPAPVYDHVPVQQPSERPPNPMAHRLELEDECDDSDSDEDYITFTYPITAGRTIIPPWVLGVHDWRESVVVANAIAPMPYHFRVDVSRPPVLGSHEAYEACSRWTWAEMLKANDRRFTLGEERRKDYKEELMEICPLAPAPVPNIASSTCPSSTTRSNESKIDEDSGWERIAKLRLEDDKASSESTNAHLPYEAQAPLLLRELVQKAQGIACRRRQLEEMTESLKDLRAQNKELREEMEEMKTRSEAK
ncbi:hypothetical protein BC629DRAFT_1598366 [Irpex lacteus]|nr:hypothetical protein BC629DRAFT_1598366 [Irpex lacteus]